MTGNARHLILACLGCNLCFVSVGAEKAAPADEMATAKADGPLVIPTAPAEYRRPGDWKPVLYPRDLKTLARECSADQIARAKKLMARVDKTNAEGKWHATGASIDRHKCPDWFVDAKLGIFIDWGPWSLAAYCPYIKGNRLYPDWYELRFDADYPKNNRYYGMREYHEKNWGKDFKRDHFLDLFKARRFDAPAMMKVFRECGAKYVVPFLKHHGGFCLWDSSYTFRDSVDQGPHRDLAREMADACRAEGLKFGLYTSSPGEWEYPVLKDDGSIAIASQNDRKNLKPYTPDMEYLASGKVAVRDITREYQIPQTVEFIDKYDPDLIWYDYDWTIMATESGGYDIAAYFYNNAEGRKEVAVNDRYGLAPASELVGQPEPVLKRGWLRTVRGDFFTDEWGDTSDCLSPEKWHPWESCSGISKAYGNHWMETEDMVMSEREFICYFADIVARGGNLLLLVNLDGQGAMVEHQKKRLLQIGDWLKKNGEAIYATRILPPFSTPAVDYTQSKDGKTAYAIVKELTREVRLSCKVPADVVFCDLATGRRLPTRRDGSAVVVRLDDDMIRGGLPVALKAVSL